MTIYAIGLYLINIIPNFLGLRKSAFHIPQTCCAPPRESYAIAREILAKPPFVKSLRGQQLRHVAAVASRHSLLKTKLLPAWCTDEVISRRAGVVRNTRKRAFLA
jgi:hypothetical protein